MPGGDKSSDPAGAQSPHIPSGPRAIATMPVRETSTRPIGSISAMKLLDLVGRAGDLEHEALGAGVDDAGAEGVGETQRLDAVVARAARP